MTEQDIIDKLKEAKIIRIEEQKNLREKIKRKNEKDEVKGDK